MTLTEQHTIRKGCKTYDILDKETYKSKNLYNATLYAIRQHFFKEGTYLSYASAQHMFQTDKQQDYYALPTKVAQQTMRMVDKNFKSFFRAIQSFKKTPTKFRGKPKLPKYLYKENGRYMLIYTSQAISKRELDRNHVIKLSGVDVRVPTMVTFDHLNEVRVVRRLDSYVIEVVYDDGNVTPIKDDNGRYAAIDLGVSNLAAVTSNIPGFEPFIIDGRELKSINRYYNKEVANAKSILDVRNNGRKTSSRIRRLTEKRNNKVKDYLHKASRLVVNQLIASDVSVLVVGRNDGWKQDTTMGKVNNQNFVQIPFNLFTSMLEYKCRQAGIDFVKVNESHTSKCSFFDGEEICHHDRYMGRRVHRGLFRRPNGEVLNADINGSLNILRRCKPKAFSGVYGVEGMLVHPRMIKILN